MPRRTKPTFRPIARLRAPVAAFAALLATAAPAAPKLPATEVDPPRRHEAPALVVRWCSEQTPERCRTHSFPLPRARPMCVSHAELPRLTPPGWRVVAWRCAQPGQVVRSLD